MTISDKDYNKLSDAVYWTDPKHSNFQSGMKEGATREIGGKEYKILKVEVNSENGMQAMAVSPIDKNGNVNKSEIVIAYAGTNTADGLDIFTDLQTVGLNSKKLKLIGVNTDAQGVTALNFAKEIERSNPDAMISTTGHSLGEYLALMVAAEKKWRNVGFNGPDPYGILSDEAKEWVKNNPGWLTNYRNRGDAIGNLMGNGTGAEIKISLEMGLNPFKSEFHSLASWDFDKDGKLVIPENDYNDNAKLQQAEKYVMKEFATKMYILTFLEAQFEASGGGISTNEQIYLDDTKALMIIEAATSEFRIATLNVIRVYQEGAQEAERLWQTTLAKSRSQGSLLSDWEIRYSLQTVGCSEQNIIYEPSDFFQEKINQVREMSNKFDTLANKIETTINDFVQKDQDIARQLRG